MTPTDIEILRELLAEIETDMDNATASTWSHHRDRARALTRALRILGEVGVDLDWVEPDE